jgi:hypothetical protein
MTAKPRFTLRAILGCTAGVSVPLAAAGKAAGSFFLPMVVRGVVGYLVNGREGVLIGVFVGLLMKFALTAAMFPEG